MKVRLTVLTLVALALLLTACQTQSPNRQVRFRDGKQATVVLDFNSWDYIFMTRPDYREDGFAQIIGKNDLSNVFEQCHVLRDFVVVTIGWQYKPQELAVMIKEWKTILKADGFQRVAFVHGDAQYLKRGILIEDVQL